MAQGRSSLGFAVPVGIAAVLLLGSPAKGQTHPPERISYALSERAAGASAPRLAESLPEPVEALPSAVEGAGDQLEAVRAWNTGRRLPVRNGFTRPLRRKLLAAAGASSREKSGSALTTAGGERVWATRLRVEGAHRLRLHLQELRVPPGTTFWVYGAGEEPRPFGLELAGEDGLWTPSVGGEEVFFEAVLPPGAAADDGPWLAIAEVAEIVPLAPDGQPLVGNGASVDLKADTSCIVDATCVTAATFDAIAAVRSAVGRLTFIDGGMSYLCSGGLVADTDASTAIPYLLTANHCFDSQASASTLEVYWDYKTATCNGSPPSLSSVPRSSGSTLLATGAGSDFTLVRLSSVPANRVFLGWNALQSAVAGGTVLHRVSHPFGQPQRYSRGSSGSSYSCSGLPKSSFLYSGPDYGGTFGGSSGAPVLLSGGVLVGQLLGACGVYPDEGCDYASNADVDGALFATWPSVSQYLQPPTSGQAPCVRDADTACLLAGRFEVGVTFQSASSNGAAQVMSFGGQRAENDESAFFWFFGPANFEMGVKVLDACAPFGKFWVFASGLTDQGWTLTVRDSQTDAVKTYSNPLGTLSKTFADTSAFSCP